MPNVEIVDLLVPHQAPDERMARTILIAMRRMAAGGVDDASAANLLLATFGIGYQRPLMFLRVMMQELSRISQRSIAIAPCCCLRMTDGETAMLDAIAIGRQSPETARAGLARITGSLHVLPALSVVQALGDALEDLGQPLRG